jgi:cell division protease FtsH
MAFQRLVPSRHEVFLGRDWLRSDPHYSQATSHRIDAQVQQLAREALEHALGLLKPRRVLMDLLVNRLIEQETIEGAEFRDLVEHQDNAQLPLQA